MSEWSIYALDKKTEQQWISEIVAFQRGVGNALGAGVALVRDEMTPIILIDARRSDWQDWAKNLDREGKSVLLVIQENDFLPASEDLPLIDDLLVYPFRLAELLSKFRAHFQRKSQAEIEKEVSTARESIQQVNETLERIAQAKTPKRFTGIKGMQINSRHLSGLKPGGDYFDVFESEKKDFVNVLLADSSSYGLSSALLGTILSSSARLASDAQMSTAAWIQAIYQELKITLAEKEYLSLFFGRINRRDFSLHYQLYGSVEAFVVDQTGECNRLEKHGARISGFTEPKEAHEKVIRLNPRDRIILLSDGFVKGIGGEFYLQKIFHQKLEKDPFVLVNELSYQIKSKLTPGETFPGEDCSAIVIDVENRVLRLAPAG
jgi:serine phosphatase RsbU (regulator of sigma subunit)